MTAAPPDAFDFKFKACRQGEPVETSWIGYTVPFAIVLAIIVSAMMPRTDRSEWSEMPCLSSHTVEYQRPDDRPHRQGGRGGMLTAHRTVCDERASIGPVMPRGWKPDVEQVRNGPV